MELNRKHTFLLPPTPRAANTGRPHFIIVSEFCSGGDLDAFMLNNGGRPGLLFDPPILHKICLQLARALAFLHGRDMIHRDIKPPNVLLNRHGDVKIADFGLGSFIGKHQHLFDQAGTGDYFAPEVEQRKPYDSKADVFSLGLLFLAIARKHVLDAHTANPLLGLEVRGRHRVYTPAQAISAGMPVERLDADFFGRKSEMSRIILAMLDPSPEQRWAAMDVYRALGDVHSPVQLVQEAKLSPFEVPAVKVEPVVPAQGDNFILYPVQEDVILHSPPQVNCYSKSVACVGRWSGICCFLVLLAAFVLAVTTTFNSIIPQDVPALEFLRVEQQEETVASKCTRNGISALVANSDECVSVISLHTWVTSSVFGIGFLSALFIWSGVLVLFRKWTRFVALLSYLLMAVCCLVLLILFSSRQQGVWSYVFLIMFVTQLALIGWYRRQVKFQFAFVEQCLEHVFIYLGKHKSLIWPLLFVVTVELLMFYVGMLFFIAPSSLVLGAVLFPYLWLHSISRNLLHFTVAKVVVCHLRGELSRGLVGRCFREASTTALVWIIVCSFFTVMSPVATGMNAAAKALRALAIMLETCGGVHRPSDLQDDPTGLSTPAVPGTQKPAQAGGWVKRFSRASLVRKSEPASPKPASEEPTAMIETAPPAMVDDGASTATTATTVSEKDRVTEAEVLLPVPPPEEQVDLPSYASVIEASDDQLPPPRRESQSRKTSQTSKKDLDDMNDEEALRRSSQCCGGLCSCCIACWMGAIAGIIRLVAAVLGLMTDFFMRWTIKYNLSTMVFHNCNFFVAVRYAWRARTREAKRYPGAGEAMAELIGNNLVSRVNTSGCVLIATAALLFANSFNPAMAFFAFVVGYLTSRTVLEVVDAGVLVLLVSWLEQPTLLNAVMYDKFHAVQNNIIGQVMKVHRENKESSRTAGGAGALVTQPMMESTVLAPPVGGPSRSSEGSVEMGDNRV